MSPYTDAAFAREFDFWFYPGGQWKNDECLRFIPPNAQRVLDAGCGSGALALRLCDHVRQVVGFDASPAMIDLARAHQSESQKQNVSFVVADLRNPPFAENSFDLIVSYYALHHVQPSMVLPILRRLVKPGGRMMISDLVSPISRLRTLPAWHVMRILRSLPFYLRRYGWRETRHYFSFQLSPGWIHELCEPKLSPEAFARIYREHLPACQLHRKSGRMTALWNAPAEKRTRH